VCTHSWLHGWLGFIYACHDDKRIIGKRREKGPLMALLFSCYLVACIVFPVHTVVVMVAGQCINEVIIMYEIYVCRYA